MQIHTHTHMVKGIVYVCVWNVNKFGHSSLHFRWGQVIKHTYIHLHKNGILLNQLPNTRKHFESMHKFSCHNSLFLVYLRHCTQPIGFINYFIYFIFSLLKLGEFVKAQEFRASFNKYVNKPCTALKSSKVRVSFFITFVFS